MTKRRNPTDRPFQLKVMLSKEERDGLLKLAKTKGIRISDIVRRWIRTGVGMETV